MQYFKHGRKIHIKESLKGSFTRYCGGNVTLDCINKGKNSPNPAIRKKATFADNARKWKHQWGGTMKPLEDEYDNSPIDFTNIHIDEESLNPYGKFTFGLPESYDKWYKGKKSGTDNLTVVREVYTQLQKALSSVYSKLTSDWIDQKADFMTRHYIAENGWRLPSEAGRVGGFGKAGTIQSWVTGMAKWYPNSMQATTYKAYVEGLKKNIQGNKYNSEWEDNRYYDNLFKGFGPNTTADRLLKQVRGIK